MAATQLRLVASAVLVFAIMATIGRRRRACRRNQAPRVKQRLRPQAAAPLKRPQKSRRRRNSPLPAGLLTRELPRRVEGYIKAYGDSKECDHQGAAVPAGEMLNQLVLQVNGGTPRAPPSST